MKTWSKYQTDIFNFIEHGRGNAVVVAVAGSGKTTTIVEGTKKARGASLFLAFNKSIATELSERGVNARTFHSLSYSVVTKFKRSAGVEPNKLRILAKQVIKFEHQEIYSTFVQRLVALGRHNGIGILHQDTENMWSQIVEVFDLEMESEFGDIGLAIEYASALLTASNASQLVDFDDLLYMTLLYDLKLPQYDFVFVDEAQDTNAVQRAILRKIMKPTSRLIAVGDPHQAIYGFRGADSDSLDIIAHEFNCIKLPLSVCYRCPTKVIKYAQKYVDHIEAAPDAPEGRVVNYGTQWDLDILKPGSMVVCRTTKPLIQLAYRMLRAHKPVYIMGKDIGQGLKTLINKMKGSDVTDLVTKLLDYTQKEIDKAKSKMNDGKVEALQDKTDCILCLVEGLDEDKKTISALLRLIDDMFEPKIDNVVFATIHKAKGLEQDHVFWLNSELCPPKWVKGNWQLQQEYNLCYVAITRAAVSLSTIEMPK